DTSCFIRDRQFGKVKVKLNTAARETGQERNRLFREWEGSGQPKEHGGGTLFLPRIGADLRVIVS
ncbi:MAG TPA: hypothetical protein PK782_08295, partial [Nitrospira sp.]|nr:hypothetical protein [Nitrospira sp.]HND02064.1 hypothetical protein [Nitrospira sp.]